MSLENIISEVKTILSGVTGVGTKIYDFERYVQDIAGFDSLFKESGKVRAWTISYDASAEEPDTTTSNLTTHTVVIRGYYGLDDSAASEKTFRGLIEAIRDAFRLLPQLNGKADWSSPAYTRRFEPRKFFNTLVHYAEIVLDVTEHIQWR
jgi:hypothetical protein